MIVAKLCVLLCCGCCLLTSLTSLKSSNDMSSSKDLRCMRQRRRRATNRSDGQEQHSRSSKGGALRCRMPQHSSSDSSAAKPHMRTGLIRISDGERHLEQEPKLYFRMKQQTIEQARNHENTKTLHVSHMYTISLMSWQQHLLASNSSSSATAATQVQQQLLQQ